MTKKSTLNKGIFTAGVVGAMVAAPYVADELNLTQDTTGGEDGFSLADVISMKEAAAFVGGSGTVEDPYLVSTGDDLRAIGNDLTAHYKLVNDINLGNVLWEPIGTVTTSVNKVTNFTGTLDGNGHTISNLNINTTVQSAGFFGQIGDNAIVKNLTFNHVEATSTHASGRPTTLAGAIAGGTVENVHIKDAYIYSIKSSAIVGGLAGVVSNDSLVSNITFEGKVENAGTHTGGIGGSVYGNKTKFVNVSSAGEVTSTRTSGTNKTGGIFGLFESATVENLVSTANVTAYTEAGGLIGNAVSGKIIRGIAYGKVAGTDAAKSKNIGGIVGNIATGTKIRLVYAFNDKIETGFIETTGKVIGDDLNSPEFYGNAYEAIPGENHSLNVGDVITNEEIFKKSTYEIFGFDFENTWTMVEGQSAPVLKIQQSTQSMDMTAAEEAKYSFTGGSGTISDPYLVSTVDDVRLMQKNPTSHFKLINDIDLAWMLLEPIGTYKVRFTGSFDGNGYTLSNLNINKTTDYTGLFGVSNGGFIKDLTINNAEVVSTKSFTGIIAGWANDTSISNVKIIGDVTVKGADYVGGIAGSYTNDIRNTTEVRYVTNIEVHGNITGKDWTGGVFGFARGESNTKKQLDPRVTSISSHANVTGVDGVGGVIGQQRHVYMTDVISYGDVVGETAVGGISNIERVVYSSNGATSYGTNKSTIKNVIAYGSVSGVDEKSQYIGGILGRYDTGSVSNIFAYNSFVGTGKAGTIGKAIGYDIYKNRYHSAKALDGAYQFHTVLGDASVGYVDIIVSDEQVNSKAFYTNKTTMDFGKTWIMNEGQHPTLSFAPYKADHTFTQEEQTGSQFAGGSGSIEDPFLIATPEHLRMVAQNITAHFKLVNDIDMDWEAWTSDDRIGSSTTLEFSGSFDGNGYAIKNLNIVGSETYTALFGYVHETGVIKNLKIENAEATSTKTYLGILVGQAQGLIENVQITGDVVMNVTGDYAGILAAKHMGNYDTETSEGLIKNVYVEGTINGPKADYLGAIGTITAKAQVEGVVADVDINGATKLGSFAGSIAGAGTYKDIIAKGNVTGDQSVGGYVGTVTASSTHEKIFAYGAVKGIDDGSKYIGGVIGYASAAGTKIKGMYAMNPIVDIGDTEYIGAAIGRSSTSSSFTPQFVSAINTLAGSGHSTHVSTNITSSTYNQLSTYTRHGFMFDETDAFAIDAGGAPYLKAFPEKITFNGSGFTFSSLIDANELIGIATTAIDLAESTLLSENIEAAQLAINDVPASAKTQKNQLQSRLDGVREYANASKAVDYALQTLKEGNLNDARVLINKLSSASQRNALNARLVEVGVVIDEQNALADVVEVSIVNAERLETREAIEAGLKATEAMMESNIKKTFLDRLDKVTTKLDTIDLVNQTMDDLERNIGESTARKKYFDTTNLITRSSVIIDISPYTPRLAQAYIDLQIAELHEEAVTAATKAVVSAESTPSATNVENAQILIDVLPNIAVKTVLQNRLDAVKAEFADVLKAMEAVTKVEATLNQNDYNTAKGLVDALEAGTDKNNLTNRLNSVLTKMQQAEKIAKATEAVVKAENTLSQDDYNAALTLVNGLSYGTERTDLANRLTAVLNAINAKKAIDNATAAVVKAEGSKTQADVNTARNLVSYLPNGDAKTELTARLDQVQAIIQASAAIATATQAVVTAENTKQQTYVNSARTLVNALPESEEKTALTARLDKVQADIDYSINLNAATQAVVKAEGSKTQADVDSARTLVNALRDGADKTNLTNRLNAIQTEIDAKAQLENLKEQATTAVETAETTKSQVDVDTARTLVNQLPDGSFKDSLKVRLDSVQSAIDLAAKVNAATQAVVKAEGSKAQADVDSARTLVNALPNGTDKTNLTNRLNTVQAAIDLAAKVNGATQAVVKAEGSKAQADVDSARTLVNALPDGADKTALNERLDAIQVEIDKAKAEAEKQKAVDEATQAVVKAEGTKAQADVDTARQKVNALPDGADKTALNERLDAVQKAINDAKAEAEKQKAIDEATQAVVKAETTKTQVDVDNARTLVNELPDGEEKTALIDRLDKVQAEIDKTASENAELQAAKEAVSKAESTKSQSDVDNARTLVNELPDGTDKTALTDRLDKLQAEIDNAKQQQQAVEKATEAVVKAEGTKTQADVDNARTLVNELPDGADKTALTDRLDAVQKAINDAKAEAEKQKAVDEATEAVVKAETTKSQEDIDTAKDLVNKLPDGAEKDALQDRLDKVQAEIDNAKSESEKQKAIDDATQAVVKAETTKSQDDVDDARTLVNALPDGEEKTALIDRLDKVQAEIDNAKAEAEKQKAIDDATQAVVKAETTKSQDDVDDARTLVNALPDGEEKTALIDRLDKVQAEIDKDGELENLVGDATAAVEVAETTKSQGDVNNAREKVNALPDGEDKDALTDRLDKVQAEIDAKAEADALEKATIAVEKAEGTKNQADVDVAKDLVNKLKDGAEKDALEDRLNKIQAEIDAKNAEQEADNALYERIKTEVLGINNSVLNYFIKEAQYAETLTTLEGLREEAKDIKDEAKRNEVNLLIDGVVDLITLLQAIEAGDTSKIDNLPDSVVKDKLKNDIVQKDLLADATSKVVKAEETLDDNDIRDAQTAVNKLKNSADKQALQKRLDALKLKAENNRALTDATAAVQKAESSSTNFNINSAQNKVNALPEGADKDALQARIDAIHEKLWQEALAKATKAVETAEDKRVTYFVNQAKSAVTALKDSPEKEALAKRIADLEKDILTQAELDRLYNSALQAVEKAEGSTLEFLLTSAQRAVDKVSDNDTRKAGLQERLDVLYKAKALREVAVAVERAERSPSDTTINNAQAVINQLDEGEVRDGYQARLDAASKKLDDERYAAAQREVVKAETNKSRAAVQAAQEKVDLVKDSERKTALQDRLDSILEWIEYMENLDGKFLPGDNIVDVAKTVKDENVKNYLVDWATAIDNAERYYSNANSAKPANVLTGIPASVLADERYKPLIDELKARTDVINKARTEYVPLRASVVKAAYNVLYDFENDRTQAKYDAALAKINALQNAEKGDNTRKALLERLNRIEVKK